MAQRDSADAAADEGGADVADDGFDFGELGHRAGNVTDTGRQRRRPGRPALGRLPPADVPAEDLALELDRLGGLPAQALRLGEGGGDGGHVEHPAAADAEHAVGVARGAGVEDGDARRAARRDGDRGALLRLVRDSRATASTVVTATPGRSAARSAQAPRPAPRAQNAVREAAATSGSTTCVSGSPSRQLNSTTQGVPSGSTMRPA